MRATLGSPPSLPELRSWVSSSDLNASGAAGELEAADNTMGDSFK